MQASASRAETLEGWAGSESVAKIYASDVDGKKRWHELLGRTTNWQEAGGVLLRAARVVCGGARPMVPDRMISAPHEWVRCASRMWETTI